jgi:hypothetical protein
MKSILTMILLSLLSAGGPRCDFGILATSLGEGPQLRRSFAAGLQVITPTIESPDPVTRTRVTETYANLPLSFEANFGQADGSVDYIARGNGYTVSLKQGDAAIALTS